MGVLYFWRESDFVWGFEIFSEFLCIKFGLFMKFFESDNGCVGLGLRNFEVFWIV